MNGCRSHLSNEEHIWGGPPLHTIHYDRLQQYDLPVIGMPAYKSSRLSSTHCIQGDVVTPVAMQMCPLSALALVQVIPLNR